MGIYGERQVWDAQPAHSTGTDPGETLAIPPTRSIGFRTRCSEMHGWPDVWCYFVSSPSVLKIRYMIIRSYWWQSLLKA